jgi:4-amino-4-deoxy-L-arabinose transferase-like glycosyltransferase
MANKGLIVVKIQLIRDRLTGSVDTAKSVVRHKNETFVVSALLLLAFLMRLRNLNSPVSGSYTFRNTQTAWGIRSVANGTISPFSVETPVFGAPWKVPFEFPLYQIISGVLSRLVGLSVEASGRLVSLTFFVLTALIFYRICRFFFQKTISYIGLAFLLFSAHNLEYGSSVLVENCALFFALAAFLAGLKFVHSKRPLFLYLFGLCSVFTSLVKITTSAIWVLLGAVTIAFLFKVDKRTSLKLLGVGLIGHIPAIVWTRWADEQKSKSVMTDWLTSKNLQSWNFGTLRQRIFYFEWDESLTQGFIPSVAGLTAVAIGLIAVSIAFHKNQKIPLTFLCMFLSGPIVFTNLYFVHNYYWTAVLPAFVLLLVSGLETLLQQGTRFGESILNRTKLFTWIIAIGLIVASWFSVSGMRHFEVFTKPGSETWNGEQVGVAVQTIRKFTSQNDQLVIVGMDWNPQILYFSNRKGLMIPYNWDVLEILNKLDVSNEYQYLYWFDENQVNASSIESKLDGYSFERISENLFKFSKVDTNS